MPVALLEMTRSAMQYAFSSVIPKKIYTFQFSRNNDSNEISLQEKCTISYSKFQDARKSRGVICTTPESIKSLLLKYVECMNSGKKASEARLILDMWKQSGFLMLDEIDVLTHPLKSELNFPIGHTTPIDLFNDRWNLPILLISKWSDHGDECDIAKAIREGTKSLRIQHDPHLVLLDLNWYQDRLVPLFEEIAIQWLCRSSSSKSDAVVWRRHLRQLLQNDNTRIDDVQDIRMRKRILLCSNWIRFFLPHCISKIHRVSYGLLRYNDAATLTRRFMAVRGVCSFVRFIKSTHLEHSSIHQNQHTSNTGTVCG